MFLLITGAASFAQSKARKAPKEDKAPTAGQASETKFSVGQKPNSNNVGKKGFSKSGTKEAATPVAKAKKEGTPDMRHKVNKQANKPAGKL